MPQNDLGHQRCPRKRHTENKVTCCDRFGNHFLSFRLICWGLFLSIVFNTIPGSICHGCGLYFDTLFWYLFIWPALLVLVCLCNHSIRKLVFRRSEGIVFNTCSAWFADFVSRSNNIYLFGVRIFEHFWNGRLPIFRFLIRCLKMIWDCLLNEL